MKQQMQNPRKKRDAWRLMKLALASGLVLAVGGGLGYWLGYGHAAGSFRQAMSTIHPVREDNQEYHFIYPLLYYDFGDTKQLFEDHTLKSQIKAYIQAQYADNNAQSISVAVRDFSELSWAGVNQDVIYQPGSMLKVLIMMAYFREAELDSSILQKTLLYSQLVSNDASSLNFNLPSKLTVGTNYKVIDLIKDMIADSDNGAETLLIENVDRDTLNQAYVDLGIPSPDVVQGDYTLSPAQYINFLRILYNSTYLSEAYSEEALSIMSQSTYKDGIVAGVPAGITVAQKYGERVDSANGAVQAVELHDCGIVYAPDHTYALCIMTKGSDVNQLTAVLKGISGLIYNYLTAK